MEKNIRNCILALFAIMTFMNCGKRENKYQDDIDALNVLLDSMHETAYNGSYIRTSLNDDIPDNSKGLMKDDMGNVIYAKSYINYLREAGKSDNADECDQFNKNTYYTVGSILSYKEIVNNIDDEGLKKTLKDKLSAMLKTIDDEAEQLEKSRQDESKRFNEMQEEKRKYKESHTFQLGR
jgi:hypothetical protein